MKRRIRLLAIMAALLLAAVACAGSSPDDAAGGGGEDGEGGGELVWAIGGAEAQPGALHTQIADLWSEENPDTPVRIEVLPEAADEQRQQQALILQSQSDEFDLLGMDVIWTGEYSTAGWLESFEDVRPELEEAGVLPATMESASWQGELWAAPLNTNAGFFYYRTDLMDAAPTTWEEATEMCVAAAEEEGINAFVGQGAQYEGMVVNYLEYFFGGGGNMFNEDSTEVLFGTDEAAVTAMTFMQESATNGFYAPGFNTMMENEAQAEFLSGQAACMRNWPSFYTLLEDEEAGSEVAGNFDVAPLPSFSGDVASAVTGGFNTAVNAYSSNVDAAKEFAVWAATNPEVQLMYAEGNLPPVTESAYSELSDNKVMATLSEILPDARPRPPSPQWNNISLEMQEAVFSTYNGDGDPQAAVDTIAEFLQSTVE